MPNKHKLGVYLAPHHDPRKWEKHLLDIDPGFIRILMPGDSPTDLVSMVHEACPEAHISLRWWDLDDGGETEKRKKLSDPYREAPKYVKTMYERVTAMEVNAKRNGLPFPLRSQLWFNAPNEPPVWENDMRPNISAFSWLGTRGADSYGFNFLALELSVGHPAEWPPDWVWAKDVFYNTVQFGGAIALHEYWQPEGPMYEWKDSEGKERKDWGALAGRYQHMPSKCNIVITEAGVDGRIYNRHKPPHVGWQGFLDGTQYADQFELYLTEVKKDVRIASVLPFLTDFQNEEWESYDTLPATDYFDSMLKNMDDNEPPVVVTPPESKYVQVPAEKWARMVELVDELSYIQRSID